MKKKFFKLIMIATLFSTLSNTPIVFGEEITDKRLTSVEYRDNETGSNNKIKPNCDYDYVHYD